MEKGKCAANCSCGIQPGRRNFIKNTSIAGLGTLLLLNNYPLYGKKTGVKVRPIRASGPASGYTPKLMAACEADLGAVAAHTMVQYLFDRPGFQQDPVCDTSDDTIIGAHCNCPTRLNGFNNPSEPFDIVHHHGDRDAVPRTIHCK